MTLIGSGVWGAPSAAWGVDVWGAVESSSPPINITEFSVGSPFVNWSTHLPIINWSAAEPVG